MAKKRFENCSFLEAVHHAKNGCKIKRKNQPENFGYFFDSSNILCSLHNDKLILDLNDFEAQDWIAFTEE